MKNLIGDYFKYIVATSVITMVCFNITLGGHQFNPALEPVYAQTSSTGDSAIANGGGDPDAQDRELNSSHSVVKEKLPSVKITSLSKGQQVSTGKLEIFGTSSDTPAAQCEVSVMLNGIKPYQHVIPIGQSKTGDFSKWRYLFTPQYGIVNKGMNKITSKISCINESGIDLTKFNSINVVGTSNNSLSVSQQSVKLKSTTTGNRTTQSSSTDIARLNEPKQCIQESKIDDNTIDCQKFNTKINIANPNSKSLSIFFDIDRDPVIRGHEQTITVTLYDSNTNARIVGANVTGQITNSFDSAKKKFAGITDTNGELSYSWKIPHTSKSNGNYKVKVSAAAIGYPLGQYTTIFKVKDGHSSDVPFILAQANGKFNEGLVDTINDFTQGMLDNVKQKLNTTSNW